VNVTRIHRLLRLITLLQSGRRYDVEALMQELGVSRRTLFRDLNVLEAAGVPYYFDDQARTYAIRQTYFLPPVNLTLQESLALLLLTRKFLSERVTPHFEAAMRAAIKIESSLPGKVQQHCGPLLDAVEIRWPPTSDIESIRGPFDLLHEAIVNRHCVRIRYESYYEQREIQTVLEPYRLVFMGRGWYVIGRSRMHQAVRTFKLERIVGIEMLNESFVPDKKFNIAEYFGNAWHMIRDEKTYHVRVLFKPMVAGNVEEVLWHPTQRIERTPDGCLLFEADVDGIREISWWVLGYGDQAVVLEPPELRELIRRHAEGMLAAYRE